MNGVYSGNVSCFHQYKQSWKCEFFTATAKLGNYNTISMPKYDGNGLALFSLLDITPCED